MAHIWVWYGFDMAHYQPYQTHILHILPLYCLWYGKDTYFVKIHTIPICGNDMGYGNDMGALIIAAWYGNCMGAWISPHTNSISMGKIRISSKSILFPYMGKVWDNRPISIPYTFIYFNNFHYSHGKEDNRLFDQPMASIHNQPKPQLLYAKPFILLTGINYCFSSSKPPFCI